MFRSLSERAAPLVIGHRGAAGYAPENTMVSFARALALRVDAIELDVHPTRDGELVVMHDATLDRTTNGHGLISAHSLADIRELDAGSWFGPAFAGERVPTFREVLEWARGRTPVVIEIKQGPIFYPDIERQILTDLEQTGMRGDAMVISFDHVSVRRFKERAPDVPTGVLYAGRCINPVALAQDAGAEVLMPLWALLTREEVEAAHRAGLYIAPWGGPEQDFRYILATGVDAVATDFPDRPRLIMEAATADTPSVADEATDGASRRANSGDI